MSIYSPNRKQKALVVLALFSFVFFSFTVPSQSYDFAGYYAPTPLVSPLQDNLVYTPVGTGLITSKAGFRVHPVTGKHSFHSGVDLKAKLNDRVYNLLPGIVTRVGKRGNLGVSVEVYHPYPNVRTINGHLNAYAVLPGMWVERGRVIGYAGSTGRSTGVHLHYTVIKADSKEYIEPMDFLKLIPHYVMALRSAQAQAAAKANLRNMPKPAEKPEDTDSEDLPDGDESG